MPSTWHGLVPGTHSWVPHTWSWLSVLRKTQEVNGSRETQGSAVAPAGGTQHSQRELGKLASKFSSDCLEGIFGSWCRDKMGEIMRPREVHLQKDRVKEKLRHFFWSAGRRRVWGHESQPFRVYKPCSHVTHSAGTCSALTVWCTRHLGHIRKQRRKERLPLWSFYSSGRDSLSTCCWQFWKQARSMCSPNGYSVHICQHHWAKSKTI